MKKLFFVFVALMAVVSAAIWGDWLTVTQVGLLSLAEIPLIASGSNSQTALKDLQEKRGKLAQDMINLNKLAEIEKRSFTADEETRWAAMETDLDKYDAEIRRYQKISSLESGFAEVELEKQEQHSKNETRDEFEAKYSAAFRNYVIGGIEILSADERKLLRSNYSEDGETRAMTTQTGATGGYAIPKSFEQKIEIALLNYCNLLPFVTTFNTSSGNDLHWPTINDTENEGAMLGENTTFGDSVEPTLSEIIFKSYKFSSKPVIVPFELTEDNEVGLENILAEMLGERIGRAMNRKFTLGTGSSQPQGVVIGATNASLSGVGATAITFDNLIDLEHSVDIAYRTGAKFMFNDATLKALRKLKDSENRYIWQPSVVSGVPATLNGREYIINDFMASIGASAKSILFGDFKKFRVRFAGQYRFRRLVERYADTDQVAYVAFRRADSHVMNAGTAPIKYLVHAAS